MRPTLLIVMLSLLVAPAVSAYTIRAVETFHNIGVQVLFPAAPPAGTAVTMAIRPAGDDGPFRPIHPLSRVSPTEFAGSAFGLQAGTTYAIRLASAAFPSNEVVLVTTRADAFPAATGGRLYVNPVTGNDAAAGTAAQPLRTLARALQRATAGIEVLLQDGRYYEGELNAPRSGTAAAPIVIRNAPGARPAIDGTDTNFAPVWALFDAANGVYRTPHARTPDNAYLNGGHLFRYPSLADLQANRWGQGSGFVANGTHLYVRLPGGVAPGTNVVTIPRYTTALTIDHQSFLQLVGLTFCYFGYEPVHRAIYINGGDSNLVDQCVFHQVGVAVGLKREARHNTIQRCLITEWPLADWSWDAVKDGAAGYEPGGVAVYGFSLSVEGTVIRYNTFSNMFDGAFLYSTDPAGPTQNLDFHDNRLLRCNDDAVETDGVGSNVRFYNNEFHDFTAGISVAPAQKGPTYIMRNVFGASPSHGPEGRLPIKLNVGSSLTTDWVYLYHNTAWTDTPEQDGFVFWSYSKWSNVVSRNNIYVGTQFALRSTASPNPVDFDYDLLHTTTPSRFIRWLNLNYLTIPAFTAATGLETNGLAGDPRFVNAGAGDFFLASDSPAIDSGVVIPGVNDDYLGAAPDRGAFEFGARAVGLTDAGPGQLTVTWRVADRTVWQPQRTATLVPPGWGDVGAPGTAQFGAVSHAIAVTNGPAGYYRLQRRP